MSATLARYSMMAVPRYTSYPTAPHFHAGIDAARYGEWLAALDPAAPVSLYLHVPFCRQVCWYCGCNMKLVGPRRTPVADYVDGLLAELTLLAERLPGRFAISHLHWGGGTPTVLSEAELARVMDAVAARFDIRADAEIAIECDPRTFDRSMANALGATGFNRASFGVQEFDPAVQAAINRVQPPEMVEAATGWLRAAGIESVNFDLVYGLPHQTCDMLLSTVARALQIGPSRVALFGYAHVPWMAKKQRLIDEAALPGATARIAQAEAAAAALVAGGMTAIGLDHFARPDDTLAQAARSGTLRRNFQGYTTDSATTLLGIGATSIGRTPSGYVQNIGETGAWSRAVGEGRLPIAKGVALSEEDRLRAAVIEALMCTGEADLGAIGTAHAAVEGWADEAIATLAPLIADGFARLDAGHLRATEAGRPLVRLLASAFDAYRGTGAGRHSRAV
ncbi:oxygen-independent coproporphyrinogen III oxidase [Acuticoccus sp. M5D2P5]|nr:oxygen-independent coproporphyrinogen III oxidase [Acuticoccus kalidii]MCF3934736.1 oxygen-independent coproporphyrinogen III oxidase [Acuticoccus kalidii]